MRPSQIVVITGNSFLLLFISAIVVFFCYIFLFSRCLVLFFNSFGSVNCLCVIHFFLTTNILHCIIFLFISVLVSISHLCLVFLYCRHFYIFFNRELLSIFSIIIHHRFFIIVTVSLFCMYVYCILC